MERKYGCCTYTVQDDFAADPYGTAYALKDMGYSYIEFGEFGAISARQWRDVLNKSGLGVSSVHVGLNYMEAWFEHIVEFVGGLGAGTRYIVYPVLRQEAREGLDALLREAEALNAMGRRLKPRGYTLMYHNHAIEFEKLGGKNKLDILFENTDPALVQFQLDTYWVRRGGEEPAQYIRKFAGRCDIIHLKDMDEECDPAPVGEGTLDFPAILREACNCGVKHFLVEQDACKRPALDCTRASSNNVRRILETL